MAKDNINDKQGFTIIEVVLVLAIAGLIFLMVFVVIPQAMAGQRDGERRQAMARVQDSLIQYQTNNKSLHNNLPKPAGSFNAQATIDAGSEYPEECDSACSFVKNYMNSGSDEGTNNFYDPDGVPYNVVITDNMNETNGVISGSMTVGDFVSELKSGTTPSGNEGYTIEGTNPFRAHVIYIVPGGECDGEYVKKSDLRHFAVLYRLENASVYCGGSD